MYNLPEYVLGVMIKKLIGVSMKSNGEIFKNVLFISAPSLLLSISHVVKGGGRLIFRILRCIKKNIQNFFLNKAEVIIKIINLNKQNN